MLNFIAFTILLLLHYTNAFHITTLRANAITLVPFLVAFAFFNEEWVSAFTGMAVGIFMDSSSAYFSFFHTVLLMLIGLSASLIAHHFFNNNVKSAVAFSLIATLFYYGFRWLFFYAIDSSVSDSAFYLMYYALPSVIYTNIFIIPLMIS